MNISELIILTTFFSSGRDLLWPAGEQHKTSNNSFITNYLKISYCLCAPQVVMHNTE